MEKREPIWCEELRKDLRKMAAELTAALTGFKDGGNALTPEELGYRGGKATAFIQQAIDRVSRMGGGRVVLADGDYLSGTLVFASNVCLEIRKGARLLASADLADYPDHVPARYTVMDSHMKVTQSLIYAEGCANIGICGEGTIDGQGTRENFPGDETACETPGRPFLMRFIDCRGIHNRGVLITRPACWTQNYLNCEDVLLEELRVESQSNYNNDGFDIDGCRRVIIRGCRVSSGDDGLCFKGCAMRETGSILVENCEFLSSCNGIKIGTDTQGDFRNIYVRNCVTGGVSEDMPRIKHAGADSGISVEGLDGGTVERIWMENCRVVRAFSPFFMRIDKRGRLRPGDPAPGLSQIRQILLENMTGEDNGPRGSYFIGIPEQSVGDVVLKDIRLSQKGSRGPVLTPEEIPELYGVYPDAHMIDDLGDAPAYGLWTRHADKVTLIGYEVTPAGADPRPAYRME